MAKAVTTASVTITTTEAELTSGAVEANRDLLVVTNVGNYPVYIGPAGVTTATGFRLNPGDRFEVNITSMTAAIVWPFYGISGFTTAVRVLESTTA